jgi:N-acetylglucosamine kinase-like BadF-type ATPase
MTVILGTGFCIYTQKSGMHRRISGWGYLLDDGGSGFNLGRDALHAYYAAYDGTGDKTLLTEEIDRLHPGGAEKLLPYVYSEGKRAVASFAPAVFAACERGDSIAKTILDRNVSHAASLIARAAETLDGEKIPIVLAGGLTKEARMMELLRTALQSDERICVEILQAEPVNGALLLAMELEEKRNE